MCIFSRPVRDVSHTRIFARLSLSGTQFLVYSMTYAADGDLAMILPLPVALPASERSIRFIDLKPYARFFDDLDRGFSPPRMKGYEVSRGGFPGAIQKTIEVHRVATLSPRSCRR